ncbi:MAG: hypothetical protein Kow0099_22440 [Candidatus Abyssubacteria bacterium]
MEGRAWAGRVDEFIDDVGNRVFRFLANPESLALFFGLFFFCVEVYSFLTYALSLQLPLLPQHSKNHLNVMALLQSYWLLLAGLFGRRKREKASYALVVFIGLVWLSYFGLSFAYGKSELYVNMLLFSSPLRGSAKPPFIASLLYGLWIVAGARVHACYVYVDPSWDRRFKAILSYIWLVCAFCVATGTIALIVRSYSPTYYSDMWNEMIWLSTFYAGKSKISDLWLRFSNQHCIFVPRLFFLIDMFVFRCTGVFLIFMNFLLQGLAFVLLVHELRVARVLSPWLSRFLAGLYLVFLFSAAQMENFFSGYQLTFVLVFVSAIAAMSFLAMGWTRHRAGLGGVKWLLLAMVCAAVSTFSMINGILVWPVLICVALMMKLRSKDIAIVGLATVLAIGTFLALVYAAFGGFGYVFGFTAINGWDFGFSSISAALSFALRYLGSPFSFNSHLNYRSASMYGTIGLIVAVFLSLRHFLGGTRPSRFEYVHFSIMWFIVLTALVTGHGRSSHTFPGRYLTPAGIFWVSALSLLFYEANRRSQWRKLGPPCLVVLICIAFIMRLLQSHLRPIRQEVDRSMKRVYGNALLAMVVGVNDERILSHLYATEVLLPLVPMMRTHHLSVFSRAWTRHLGRELSFCFEIDQAEGCSGEFESIHFLPLIEPAPPQMEGARVRGWAWNSQAREVPPLILIVDEAGVIRGFAKATRRRDDLTGDSVPDSGKYCGWEGYVASERDSQLSAYALDERRNVVFRLRGTHRLLKGEAKAKRYDAWRRGNPASNM